MPRGRKAASTIRQSTSTEPRKRSAVKREGVSRATSNGRRPKSGLSTLTCPECGKEFTRAASLGAHRNRAHGVAGASSRTSQAGSSKTTKARRRNGGVNRDALLSALFPNGIPAKESVVREISGWLDQAERLASRD
jgi:uncharacterized C2H2 Zn-finger protein